MIIFYAWLGNTSITYGTPHKTTGRMSKHGDMFAFSSKSDRDAFCENYSARYNAYPVSTTLRKAKVEYYGGLKQHQFDEYMLYVDEQPTR